MSSWRLLEALSNTLGSPVGGGGFNRSRAFRRAWAVGLRALGQGMVRNKAWDLVSRVFLGAEGGCPPSLYAGSEHALGQRPGEFLSPVLSRTVLAPKGFSLALLLI